MEGVTDHLFFMRSVTVSRSQYLGDDYFYVFNMEKCLFKVRRGLPVLERLQLLFPRLFNPKKLKAPWTIERVVGLLGLFTHAADEIMEVEHEGNIVKKTTSKYICNKNYNVHLHLYLTMQERQPGEDAGPQHEPTLDYFLLNIGHTTQTGPWIIESLPPLAANKVLTISAKTDGTQFTPCVIFMEDLPATNWFQDHQKCIVNQAASKKFTKENGIKVSLALDIAQAYVQHLKSTKI